MDHAVVESEACCMCYNNYTNYNNVMYYTCQCHLPMVLECSLVNTFCTDDCISTTTVAKVVGGHM